MIILDEQLLGRSLETAIAHWYQGAVRSSPIYAPIQS
jgi:hypothetical protein